MGGESYQPLLPLNPLMQQVSPPVQQPPEFSLVSIQMPPVTKYDGNSEAEPFEEWLEQFE